MARRSAVLVAGIIVFAMSACGGGGGGGDEDAFCGELENLSDQIADGDLASENGLDDALNSLEAANESAADGEQTDAVEEVRQVLVDADPADATDTANEVQDALGNIADDTCNIDNFAEAPDATTTTTAPVDDTTTTTTGTGTDVADIEVNARQPVPADIAPEFAALAQSCFDGDPSACDDLFRTTPSGSPDEAYGDTCGGRLTDSQGQLCTTLMVAPTAVPSDIVDTANATACFGGDMVACDTLFNNAAQGSTDRAYGALCAVRVQNTTALCVDIFGEVSLFV